MARRALVHKARAKLRGYRVSEHGKAIISRHAERHDVGTDWAEYYAWSAGRAWGTRGWPGRLAIDLG